MKNNMSLKNLNVSLLIIVPLFVSSYVPRTKTILWKHWPPIPMDAYEVGPFLYIGKVRTESGNLVATIDTITKVATVVLDIKRQYITDIEILCTPFPQKFFWEKVDFSNSPMGHLWNAVRGGFQQDIDSVLYIGKINHEGSTKIGKVIPPSHVSAGLWVWDMANMPLRFLEFEMLKIRHDIILNISTAHT